MSRCSRIGIYGGSFDPPHLAHWALAQAAIEQHALDELRVLPAGATWYKTRPLTDAKHRLAMLHRHFDDVPRCHVDDRETRRLGPSYTCDTLMELQEEHSSAKLFVVMGRDQFEFFHHWHRWTHILHIATLLVADRSIPCDLAGPSDATRPDKIPHLAIRIPEMDVSATQIRDAVRLGQSISHLVKPAVARYIAQHRLYLPPTESP